MFVVVRFGENEQCLFNINCRTRVLYENIKERCDCHIEDVVDLADENGTLQGFPDRLSTDNYANEFLHSRSSYILLQVSPCKQGTPKTYTPMLNGINEDYPDFMAKLYNKKVNPDIAVGPRPSMIRRTMSPRRSAKPKPSNVVSSHKGQLKSGRTKSRHV